MQRIRLFMKIATAVFNLAKSPGVDTGTASQKFGRPTINKTEEGFQEIVEYLPQNDDEQITISKLNDMMKEKVSSRPYFLFTIYYEGSCLSLICLYLSELAYIEHELSAFITFRIFYYSPKYCCYDGFYMLWIFYKTQDCLI